MTTRKQWFDQQDAPNLQTLSVDYRLTDRSGLGTIVYKDQNGYHSQIGAYLTYAHHINFNKSMSPSKRPYPCEAPVTQFDQQKETRPKELPRSPAGA